MLTKSNEYKYWKKKQNKKKLLMRTKKKLKKRKTNNKRKVKNVDKVSDINFVVPTNFSIINNPEITIKFFNDVIGKVEKIRKLYKSKKVTNYIRLFNFDMENVEIITSDALMYLLTIIKNTRGDDRYLPINWVGNFPKNEEVKKYLKRSGYLNYVRTAKENIIQTDNNITIKFGTGYEYRDKNKFVDIRRQIIDFSCDKLKKDKTKINFLMTMLTEMIANINDHAYDKEGLFRHNWYIFVENMKDKITYTFMDNGLGIPSTIKKKMLEKLFEIIEQDKEYKYIEAAFSGIEKRSKTGLMERGNGLPSIYEQFINKNVENFIIISNKAFFSEKSKYDLINNLNGTIFYWEIKKESEY